MFPLGNSLLGTFHVQLGDLLNKCEDDKGECDPRSSLSTSVGLMENRGRTGT